MKKLVRPVYPVEISGVIICLIFLLTYFFSYHIFDAHFHFRDAQMHKAAYWGMFLVGIATVMATLIIWEEILFPVVVKQSADYLKVRNRRKKLHAQALLYLVIPVIFAFIYFNYHVNTFHFMAWMSVCLLAPLMQKLFSGIRNYNDFLNLSTSEIEYKNNKKQGKFLLAKVEYIQMVKDSDNILSKLKLGMNNSEVTIDLDQMELDAYYDTIQDFMQKTYKNILR